MGKSRCFRPSLGYSLHYFKGVGIGVFFIGRMGFAPGFAPFSGRKFRKKDVAFRFDVHFGEVDLLPQMRGLPVNFAATDDENLLLAIVVSQSEGFRYRMDYQHAVGGKKGVAGDDHVDAFGQWSPDALETVAAHQHVVPQGSAFEPGQIGRQVPGYLVVLSDNPVSGDGDDGGDEHKYEGCRAYLARSYGRAKI